MTMPCITSTGDFDHLAKCWPDVFLFTLLYRARHSRDARASLATAVTVPATSAGSVPGQQPRRLWGMDRTISRTLLRKSELLATERSRFA